MNKYFNFFSSVFIFTFSVAPVAFGSENKITLDPGSSALIEAGTPTRVYCGGNESSGLFRFCAVQHGSSTVCGFDNVCLVLKEQVGNASELVATKVTNCGDEDDPKSFAACEKEAQEHPSCRPSGKRDCFVKNGSGSICGFDNVCLVLRYRLNGKDLEENIGFCGDEDEQASFDKCNAKLKSARACL